MKKVITVDFDMTLAYGEVQNTGWVCLGTGVLKPIPKIINIIKEKHKIGYDIHVVTFRHDKDMQEVRSFIKEHNLPIAGIHNTSSGSKTPVLKELGSLLHIDDSLSVCMGAESEGIQTLFVNFGQKLDESQKELAFKLDQIFIDLD